MALNDSSGGQNMTIFRFELSGKITSPLRWIFTYEQPSKCDILILIFSFSSASFPFSFPTVTFHSVSTWQALTFLNRLNVIFLNYIALLLSCWHQHNTFLSTLVRMIRHFDLSPPFSRFVIGKEGIYFSWYNFSFLNITFPSETTYTCKKIQLSLVYSSNIQ